MKYMLLMQSAEPGEEPRPECTVEDWIAYDKTVQDAGIQVASHALQEMATTVRITAAGERTVTDGPFAESREMLGGYYVIDVPDLDAALDWAARCPAARDGSVQVRPVDENY